MWNPAAASNVISLHPIALVALYAAASTGAFAMYAVDKSAARQGRRRVAENTLHLWSLVGGWPGALAAQQLLRHKTRKVSFQIVFWVTVVLNCAALAWTLSQFSRQSEPKLNVNSEASSRLPRITPGPRSTDTR